MTLSDGLWDTILILIGLRRTLTMSGDCESMSSRLKMSATKVRSSIPEFEQMTSRWISGNCH